MLGGDDPVAVAVEGIPDDQRRSDTQELLALMSEVTGERPAMWGKNMFGFGRYHYKYRSGQEGDFFKVGFAPRKQELTLYIMSGLRGFDDILAKLGPHRTSKSCVYVKRLADVDPEALSELISECVRHLDDVAKSLGAIPRMSDIPARTNHA